MVFGFTMFQWETACSHSTQHLSVLVLAVQGDVDRLEKDHKADQMTGKTLIWEKTKNAGFAQPWEKKAYRWLYNHVPGF